MQTTIEHAGVERRLKPFEALQAADSKVRAMIATSVDDLRCDLRNAESNRSLDLARVEAAIALIDAEREANRNVTLFATKRGLLMACLKRAHKKGAKQ